MRSIVSPGGLGVPGRVSARLETRRFHEQPLEDTATLDLETAFGLSQIFLTWAADERANAIEIDGDRGQIHVGRRLCYSQIEAGKSAAGRRPPCPKGRIIPTGSAAWPPIFSPPRQAPAKAISTRRCCARRLIDAAQRSSAAGGAWLALST